MFEPIDISKIDSIEKLKKSPLNIVVCETPYWDRVNCIIIELLFKKKYKYNFQIHRFKTANDFYEKLVNLNNDQIDNIHAYISHNHSNSEHVLSLLNKQKLESKRCICVTVSSIRDDSRTFDFIEGIKAKLNESIDIFVDVFMGMKEKGFELFFDALIEKWYYNIRCRNENIKIEHTPIDLHKILKNN